MEGLKVICPNCRIVRHETTEFYDPNQVPRGHFLRLLDPWKSWHWNCYDDEGDNLPSTTSVLMCCPGCSAPLVLKGSLTIAPEPEKAKTQAEINQEKMEAEFKEENEKTGMVEVSLLFSCETCGKECKSLAGLKAHQRSHK